MAFISDIRAINGEIYAIGGSVRNLIYNDIHGTKLLSKDRDFVVRQIKLDDLTTLLKKHGTVKEVGKCFGVIKFRQHNSDEEFDISIPRQDISTGDGHKDFKIYTDHKLELVYDCTRRDATINAIALQIFYDTDLINFDQIVKDKSRIKDYFGGVQDIKDKLWRAIEDPDRRFKEDPLRMLRACRQSAELDLDIEKTTKVSITKNCKLVEVIKNESSVRVANEIVRLVSANTPYNMIKYLYESGIASVCDINLDYDICSLFKNITELDIRVRLIVLLNTHRDKNSITWTQKYQLSAAPNYSSKYVDIFKCCHEFYFCIENITDKYTMRKFIQNIEAGYQNKGVIYSELLIRYYGIIKKIDVTELLRLHTENKDIPLTINDVKISGTILMEKYKLFGKNIKSTKIELLNLITLDKLKNTMESIMEHLDKNLIM